MGEKRTGYFEADRGTYDDPFFVDESPLTKREAWFWLRERAAWKPRGVRRHHSAVVDVARGQLAVTHRELAKAWGWSKSHVDRFLEALVVEGRIMLGATVGTRNEPIGGRKESYKITTVNICDYDAYRNTQRRKMEGSVRDASAESGRDFGGRLRLPAASLVVSKQNKRKANLSERGACGVRSKPRHGATGDGMIWLDYGTLEWGRKAEDFRKVTGADKLSEARIGGRGNWFVEAGEATRHKHG